MEKGTRQGAQKEFVFKNGQAYGITQQGRDYVEGLSLNSAFSTAAGTAKYKEEALSGIVERKSKKTGFMVSEKSKLTRAVLFSHAKHHSSKSPEDFILEQDAIKKARVKIAKQIGITVEELEKAVEEERVKVCKGCGEIEIHHKNLKGLRSKCVKCSKGDRK
ncbi:hypothetical protein KAR91_53230 [Candidatus Pacearchaeota archaeon]|nr:hypothetical protein [Candidatus Pacearchaeota archaeon]